MQLVDRVVDLVHPARLPRRHEGVGEHSGAFAAHSIDHVRRLADLIVLQELPRVVIERRAAQQRDRRVAVEEDLPNVVLELVDVEVIRLPGQRGVPVLRGEDSEPKDALLGVLVVHEVGLHVHDELALRGVRARGRDVGVGRLGLTHVEQVAKDLVHRQEGCRHAARRLQEPPAVEALPRPVGVGQLLDTRFYLALLWRLREGVKLPV